MNKIINEKIGVSALTASILGLKKIKTNAKSFQAYFMVGTKCMNSCAFCAQSQKSAGNNELLSRVSWPSFDIDIVIKSLQNNNIIKKGCFQVVGVHNYFNNFIEILSRFNKSLNIPFGASIDVYDMEQIDTLFRNNLINLGIAIDAASYELYNKIKRKNISFDKIVNLAIEASKKYPSKITAHIIVGLGESDFDLIKLFTLLKNNKVNIALFAFTPIKGTEIEYFPKVELKRYRQIQFLRQYIYSLDDSEVEDFTKNINFTKTMMIDSFSKKAFKDSNRYKNIIKILNEGDYLKTSGCNLCNRPYYNDEPLEKDLYNFHFNPPIEIVEKWKNFFIEKFV